MTKSNYIPGSLGQVKPTKLAVRLFFTRILVVVCSGLPAFLRFHSLSYQIMVVVWGSLRWFVVVCGGLSYSHTRRLHLNCCKLHLHCCRLHLHCCKLHLHFCKLHLHFCKLHLYCCKLHLHCCKLHCHWLPNVALAMALALQRLLIAGDARIIICIIMPWWELRWGREEWWLHN